jgi:signal transduction histidine kinase
LSPEQVENLEFEAAVERVATKWSEIHDIRCVTDIDNIVNFLSVQTRGNLIRIVQESLTNIAQHADAAEVLIAITVDFNSKKAGMHHNGELTLTIEDDGCGMQLHNHPRGMGLLSMRERANAIDGTFRLQSMPGKGTKITVALPIDNVNTINKRVLR